jgi:hypothetical protein
MMKKPSKTTLKRKADKLFSDKVRSIGKCEICGSTKSLQCCYFITRRILKLRYEPWNAACLCGGCHFRGHQHPRWFTDEWDRIKGKGTTNWLEMHSYEIEPIKREFFEKIVKGLKKEGKKVRMR